MHTATANQTTDNNIIAALFGSPLHFCSREQLIEDGYLVDLMQDEMLPVCKQHYRFPIACTEAVFEIMREAVEDNHGQDYAEVLHNMLSTSKRGTKIKTNMMSFRCAIAGTGYDFKLNVYRDLGEPVITIMLPHED